MAPSDGLEPSREAPGGVEPRKGTIHTFRALARLKREGIDAVLVIVGGQSFQDYTPYREHALALLPRFSWAASARRHQQIYAEVRGSSPEA